MKRKKTKIDNKKPMEWYQNLFHHQDIATEHMRNDRRESIGLKQASHSILRQQTQSSFLQIPQVSFPIACLWSVWS